MAGFLSDHLGRQVPILDYKRIVSLCPSQTQTLIDLGVGERLVGRTRFCIHPEEVVSSIEEIGGTKQLNFDKLKQLQPDLIIAEKEENTPAMIEELERDYPVFVTDVTDLNSAFTMMEDLGVLTGTRTKAEEYLEEIKSAFNALTKPAEPKTVIYLIWRKPYMAAGQNTYIGSILDQLGFENLALNLEGRYPETPAESLKELNPDVLMLSSEPFPFGPKHQEELQEILPQADVVLVDGEMFSWYGTRMLAAAEYFEKSIFPRFH